MAYSLTIKRHLYPNGLRPTKKRSLLTFPLPIIRRRLTRTYPIPRANPRVKQTRPNTNHINFRHNNLRPSQVRRYNLQRIPMLLIIQRVHLRSLNGSIKRHTRMFPLNSNFKLNKIVNNPAHRIQLTMRRLRSLTPNIMALVRLRTNSRRRRIYSDSLNTLVTTPLLSPFQYFTIKRNISCKHFSIRTSFLRLLMYRRYHSHLNRQPTIRDIIKLGILTILGSRRFTILRRYRPTNINFRQFTKTSRYVISSLLRFNDISTYDRNITLQPQYQVQYHNTMKGHYKVNQLIRSTTALTSRQHLTLRRTRRFTNRHILNLISLNKSRFRHKTN